ncbi:MAG: carboxypeptidase-like regulatory domain-containing protein [Bacteroidales bacterium]
MNYIRPFFVSLLLFPLFLSAQETSISGKILDQKGSPVPEANVYFKNSPYGTITDNSGDFKLTFTTGNDDTLMISSVGYSTRKMHLNEIDTSKSLIITLNPSVESIDEVRILSFYQEDRSLMKIEKKDFALLPTSTGELESIIKNMPGVSSRNELSYQYSVRGGNFDENLIYVNDVEIYRPIIVRSGKQEGLSFINSDMISSVSFSAGGFESHFGDKMSSVLNIKYMKPKEFNFNSNLSLLGASAHIQDVTESGRFTYNIGVRYKSTQYLLNSLDVEGDYNPTFYDVQSYLTYDLNKKWDLEFLGNYNLNTYRFEPQTRSTSFGTFRDALNFTVYYEGEEKDVFENYMGALSAIYNPSSNLTLKFIGSSFNTIESETYDIFSEYYLNELDKSMNSSTYGDSLMNLGTGGFLEHARNYLQGTVYSLAHKGIWNFGNNLMKWGMKYRREIIHDDTNEWKLVDSAGYSIPYSENELNLYHVLNAENNLQSNRYSAFIQNTYEIPSIASKWYINTGFRVTYWEFGDVFILSPRLHVTYEPVWKNNLGLHFSVGSYSQPPFYKEMKGPDGSLNRNIGAQKSIHFVLGSEYDFILWNRPFKYSAEVYYKDLDNIIPYKSNNVRLRYAGENLAKGYAAGLDMRINGEFVEGIESWASLSIMETKEKITDKQFLDEHDDAGKGYYPRPTDQLINFSLYFQDYVPNFPTYKAHISLHFGSKLPFSSPESDRYDEIYYMPPYRRLDLGFSKSIKQEKNGQSKIFSNLESLWLGFDIFNVLDINNTISYQWIRTVGNQTGEAFEYAIPNYLTSRRYNLKVILKF